MFEVKSVKIRSEEIRISGAILSLNISDTGSTMKIVSGGQTLLLDSKVIVFEELSQAFSHLLGALRMTVLKPERKPYVYREGTKKRGRPRKTPLVASVKEKQEASNDGPRRVII